MKGAYIHDAVRTPRGRAHAEGGLAALTPAGLLAGLGTALADRGRPAGMLADQVIIGCVGQVGAQGGHVAMVAKLAGLCADGVPVHSINNFCASGLSAIGQAAALVTAGQARHVLAGGVEMMSRVPFMGDNADYYTAADLPPVRRYIPVALAADLLAGRLGVSRAELDAMALMSQQRAAAAEARPALNASRIPAGRLTGEELPRETRADGLAALRPAFAKLADAYRPALDGAALDHRHTVAHAPPMADGAGLALVGGPGGERPPRARILAYAEAGGDPRDSLMAGFTAMDQALARAGLGLADMDRVEFMEAFAVTIAAFLRDRAIDPARVNVGGGHLAKGHPMGATGAILLSALLDALDEADGTLGLVVATGAQGVGVALVVERLA
ncbi:hypothetical protein [Niveispirillum fermenti]|uniref:thiolase family protein n=1 Tax=Niveispirillum fermenti TaxID=1233113 RepID=UPI003A83CD6C